ncbi:MAG: HAD family hydrolase, partial [Chloroflexota bacterium]
MTILTSDVLVVAKKKVMASTCSGKLWTTQMIKAVLLDLDGTLIQNDEREFVSAYLKLATEYFEENIGLSNMGDAILGSIAPMMTAQQHHSTNVEVAIDAIAKTLGQSAPDLEPLFVDFYAERFPVLQEYCASVDSANALIRLLLSMDLEVVIATNPVYPETAIFQRMEWAGIPGPEAFAYVTTGDNSHFIKPSPMYYAEIIARVGVEPEATLMVGNSLKNDIAPATALGIHTFHLNYAGDEPNIHPDQRGTLLDLIEHINTGWLDTLRPNPIHPAMIRAELQGNLGALYGLLSNVQEHQWDERPIPNEWTITEILCHLHNREVNVHRPRLKTILAQNNPFI